MFKNYKCTETGNRYKIRAMPNGLFRVDEQFGDYAKYVTDRIPSTVFLEDGENEKI